MGQFRVLTKARYKATVAAIEGRGRAAASRGSKGEPAAYGSSARMTRKLALRSAFRPPEAPVHLAPCRSDRPQLPCQHCRVVIYCGRLRHRRDRDELRDAGIALSQPLFRQRHLYLGVADLDRADRADRGLFPRRLARRPHPLAGRAGATVLVGSVYLLALPSFAQADARTRARRASTTSVPAA